MIVPETREITALYVFCGDISRNLYADLNQYFKTGKITKDLRDFYGDNIQSKFNVQLPQHSRGNNGDFPIHCIWGSDSPSVYPIDNFEELREKIYVVSNVPPFRQHIFYYDKDGARTTYNVKINGAFSPVNILKRKSSMQLNGIPIDNRYYENTIKIEPLDYFRLLNLETIDRNTIFVADLYSYAKPANLRYLLSDEYQFNLVYRGFILKFWPRFSRDAFRQFITDYNSFAASYSELIGNRDALRVAQIEERKVLDYDYSNGVAIAAWAKDNIDTHVIKAVVESANISLNVNIRNVFDYLHLGAVDQCNHYIIVEMRAYVRHVGRDYMLRKTMIGSNNVNNNVEKISKKNGKYDIIDGGNNADEETVLPFPSDMRFHRGLTIAIQPSTNNNISANKIGRSKQIIFVNLRDTGKVYAFCAWAESDQMQLGHGINALILALNLIINKINELGHIGFVNGRAIPRISNENIVLDVIESYIIWKRSLNNLNFAALIKRFDTLYDSRIIHARQHIKAAEEHEYLIHKGAYNFPLYIIERMLYKLKMDASNLYSYLTENVANKKWMQNYTGRVLQITHRTTSVMFQINSIGAHEFNAFYGIICGFLYHATKTMKFDTNISHLTNTHFYKTRKLSQVDPVLFDLKRHGSDKVFARVCQQNKQPLIYTDEELNEMPRAERNSLVKYWNFTSGRPAYYRCPSRQFPDLSFVTGQHPLGYCLPCCTKASVINKDRKDAKNSECIRTHTYSRNVGDQRHIIEFGKRVDIGRLVTLPEQISQLLYNTEELYLYGVPQSIYSINCGSLHAFSRALNLPVQTIIDAVGGVLTPRTFNTLLQGAISAYFETFDEFKITFIDVFSGRPTLKDFNQWNTIICELGGIAYDTNVFLFDVVDSPQPKVPRQIELTNIRNSLLRDPTHNLIILKHHNQYNPIVHAERRKYSVSGSINNIMFNNDSRVTIKLGQCFGEMPERQFAGWKIAKQYTNKTSLVYAHILQNDNDISVYVPTAYKPPNPEISSIYDIVDIANLPLSALQEFAAANNIQIQHYVQFSDNIVQVQTDLGVHYITPIAPNDTMMPIKQIKYNPIDVDRAILHSDAPTNKHNDKLGAALYTNYQYRLFIIEFANFIDQNRDTKLREQIYSAIRRADFNKPISQLRREIKHLILGKVDKNTNDNTNENINNTNENINNNETPEQAAARRADYTEIINQIMTYYYKKMNKEYLIEQIDQTIYQFDRVVLRQIFAMSRAEVVQYLRAAASNFTIERDIGDISAFPNVYVNCAEANRAGDQPQYCSGPKIIIKDLESMIQFLADDLTNELKRQYFLTDIWIDNYIDYFSFNLMPNEKLQIYL